MLISNLNTLLPSFSVSILADVLESAGYDSMPVLQAAGLVRAQLDDPSLLVTARQELAVERGFAKTTRDRHDLWVAAGERYQMFAYYPLGFAQITSPTLADALVLMSRFAGLHFALGDFEEVDDNFGNVGVRISYDARLHDIREFLLCKETIAFTNSMHELWGDRFPFTRIEAATSLPRLGGFDYRAPVIASAGGPAWFWPKSLMHQKLAHADSVLNKLYVTHSERIASVPAASMADPEDKLLAGLDGYLAKSPPESWTLDRATHALSMSRRSLQRGLAARGLSFRSLTDSWRQRQAQSLLATDQRPIADISWTLGYADSSSFHQAFLRWTGMSPSAFRRQVRDLTE